MARKRSHTRGTPHSYPRGTLSITRGGYGFVQTPEGEFFVPAAKMNGAFDGDLVEIAPARQERSRKALARASQPGTRREARIKRVVEHAHPFVVGRLERVEPFGVVVPEDPRIPYDIFTPLKECAGIPEGAIVRVAMATYPSRKEAATGTIVEVLGDADDERVPIDLIAARYKLEAAFPESAMQQANEARVDADAAFVEGYRDLRSRIVFTIDPDDARDYDDAVSLEPLHAADDCGTPGDTAVLANGGPPHAADDSGTPAWPSSLRLRTEVRGACLSGQVGVPQSPSLPGEGRQSPSGVDEGRQSPSSGCGGEQSLSSVNEGEALPFDVRSRAVWRLGVHIADVGYYVPWGSPVDIEARKRGTSVYLVDRVIPMLPEALSNEVCSLKPDEERRTMTVDLFLDAQGGVIDVDVYPAVIRSCARLTYTQAQTAVNGDWKGLASCALHGATAEDIAKRIHVMAALARRRQDLRAAAGGIDFDTVEAKVKLDEDGVPLEVILRKRTEATQLIEESMIAANEAVARYLRDAGFPCIYRTHDKPSRESLEGLLPVLREFAWFDSVDERAFAAGNPHVIAHVLDECADRNEGTLVTTLVLRAMKRALYEPELGAHYALASEAYAHFTSPIRRYPDLIVHRMLKAALNGRPEKFDQEVAQLAQIAEHSSQMERTAENAARESQEAKIVELMETQVGQTFSAMIAGVSPHGLFVRLKNTAEGMVDITDLGREYFVLDSVRHTLTGSDTGKEYRLGKYVAVRLVEADRRTRELRFRLAR